MTLDSASLVTGWYCTYNSGTDSIGFVAAGGIMVLDLAAEGMSLNLRGSGYARDLTEPWLLLLSLVLYFVKMQDAT